VNLFMLDNFIEESNKLILKKNC